MTAALLALRIEAQAVEDGHTGVSFGDCLTIASTLARRSELVDGDVLTTEIPDGYGGLLSAVVRLEPSPRVVLVDGAGVVVVRL